MEAVNEVIRILDREAIVGELVVLRLTAMQLLLTANEHRFLPQAAQELDEVVDRVGALETMRALACEEIAEVLGIEAGHCMLSDLLRVADERQRGELLRVQARVRAVLAEMEQHTALARDLALARVAVVRASLERLGGAPGSRYGQDGIVSGHGRTGSVDEWL